MGEAAGDNSFDKRFNVDAYLGQTARLDLTMRIRGTNVCGGEICRIENDRRGALGGIPRPAGKG